MIWSEERTSHIVSLVVDGIWNDDLVDYVNEDDAMRIAKRAGVEFRKQLLEVDEFARNKVASIKRQIVEGTPEWEVLYSKYVEEELRRRGFN